MNRQVINVSSRFSISSVKIDHYPVNIRFAKIHLTRMAALSDACLTADLLQHLSEEQLLPSSHGLITVSINL